MSGSIALSIGWWAHGPRTAHKRRCVRACAPVRAWCLAVAAFAFRSPVSHSSKKIGHRLRALFLPSAKKDGWKKEGGGRGRGATSEREPPERGTGLWPSRGNQKRARETICASLRFGALSLRLFSCSLRTNL